MTDHTKTPLPPLPDYDYIESITKGLGWSLDPVEVYDMQLFAAALAGASAAQADLISRADVIHTIDKLTKKSPREDGYLAVERDRTGKRLMKFFEDYAPPTPAPIPAVGMGDYQALEKEWNRLMDALQCEDTESALLKIRGMGGQKPVAWAFPLDKAVEDIRLRHGNPTTLTRARIVQDVSILLAHIAMSIDHPADDKLREALEALKRHPSTTHTQQRIIDEALATNQEKKS